MCNAHARLTMASHNKKTGPIPVSISDPTTCPPSCPLKGKGCYAESGNTAMHWTQAWTNPEHREHKAFLPWQEFCNKVKALPAGQVWRHNEAGDLPHVDGAINVEALADLVLANNGKRGFTYTHHDPTLASNAAAIRAANECGFTVNVSADNAAEVDRFKAMGVAPVVCLLPVDAPHKATTPAGHRIVACPAEGGRTTCQACRLCADPDRDVVIGFRAHGARKAKASQIAKGA